MLNKVRKISRSIPTIPTQIVIIYCIFSGMILFLKAPEWINEPIIGADLVLFSMIFLLGYLVGIITKNYYEHN